MRVLEALPPPRVGCPYCNMPMEECKGGKVQPHLVGCAYVEAQDLLREARR